MKFWLKSKITRLWLLLEHQEISPCPCYLSAPFPFSGVPGFHQEPTRGPGRGHALFYDFVNTESPLTCPRLAPGAGHIAATESIPKKACGCRGAACSSSPINCEEKGGNPSQQCILLICKIFFHWLFNASRDGSKSEGILDAHTLPADTGTAGCDDCR